MIGLGVIRVVIDLSGDVWRLVAVSIVVDPLHSIMMIYSYLLLITIAALITTPYQQVIMA